MLSKKNRLPKKFFKNLFSHGLWRRGALLNLIYSRDDNQEKKPRLSVLVGVKIDKRATKRNQIKRKIFQIIELIQKGYFIKPKDYVFLPKKEVLEKKQEDLFVEIINLLLKEKLVIKKR